MSRVRRIVSEIASTVSVAGQGVISVFGPFSFRGIRSRLSTLSGLSKYWGGSPAFENTLVDYDSARQLYRNDGDANLGSGFCRPIIDLAVEYIGLPSASVENEVIDDELNTCLHTYWADKIQQLLRDAMRDSKTIVRIRQPSGDDPLMTAIEREHCQLEIIVPERVRLIRDPQNKNIVNEAIVNHRIVMVDDPGDPFSGIEPSESEHEIIETITPDDFTYFDRTADVILTEWSRPNTWGFVPLVEVWNEFDAALNGGQSDLEGVYPFVRAFHDAFAQTLQAHKYHSTPKIKFKLNEVGQFLKNNFPDAFDPATGRLKAQSEISWTGKEMVFLEADEDMGFVEAKSVLGDSIHLLNFIFQCICVASETPHWAFMKIDAGDANQAQNAQTVPFTKKIERKRRGFADPIQQLLKMYLVIIGLVPVRPSITWDTIQPQDQVQSATAMQQIIMGLEVAAQRGIISDTTYREMLRNFIPMMKNPTEEAQQAQKNVQPALPAAAPSTSNGKGNAKNVPVVAGSQGKNE